MMYESSEEQKGYGDMRNRILSVILAAAMLATPLVGEARAAETDAPPGVTARVDGVEIHAADVEGDSYLFLPASADLTALTLSLEGAEATFRCGNKTFAEGEAMNLTAAGKDAEGRYQIQVAADGGTDELYVMQGSAIPTLYLTSADPAEHGRDWVDLSKSNETTGTMKLVKADGSLVYEGELTQIKPRGNSTFKRYPKKPYQIKLAEKFDLLGNGEKGKTWVLLANYGDATMVHDKTMKDLAAKLGQAYVVSCDWVDLYYDGEYRGVYTLGEKNSVGSIGVDITDMEDAYSQLNEGYGDDMTVKTGRNAYRQEILYTDGLTEVENITGGWLIERNLQTVDEANGFYTTKGAGMNLRSPEFAGREAVEYISEYYQAFEDAVYATDADGNYTGYNAKTGKYYYEYVDKTSLVRAFLLQELALNPDGFKSSLYFYKDADELMYCGPIWDQDNTLGTSWSIAVSPKVKDYRYLQEALIQIPDFEAAVTDYFHRTFAPAAEQLLGESGTFAALHTLLADSAAMNYVLWPYIRIGNPEVEGHLWAGDPDYDEVMADLQSWAAERLQVLKRRLIPSAPIEDTPAVSAFPDTAGHWAEDSIRFVAEQGIFRGTAAGFRPNASMTQAQMAVILHRMAGEPAAAPASAAWYGTAQGWTDAVGITEADFAPNAALTRAQLAVMLYRYAAISGADMRVEADLSMFEDDDSVTARTEPALEWVVGTGVMRGKTGGVLCPAGVASRAETAVMLERFMRLNN